MALFNSTAASGFRRRCAGQLRARRPGCVSARLSLERRRCHAETKGPSSPNGGEADRPAENSQLKQMTASPRGMPVAQSQRAPRSPVAQTAAAFTQASTPIVYSPTTCRRILRGRARSSSQKKTRW